MGNALGWPHLLVFLAVILLIFGAAKLPALAKSVGQSARVFKGEMRALKEDDVAAPLAATPATSSGGAPTPTQPTPAGSASPTP